MSCAEKGGIKVVPAVMQEIVICGADHAGTICVGDGSDDCAFPGPRQASHYEQYLRTVYQFFCLLITQEWKVQCVVQSRDLKQCLPKSGCV